MFIIEMSKIVIFNEVSVVVEIFIIGAVIMDSIVIIVIFKEKKGGVVIVDGKISGIKIVFRDNMIIDVGGIVVFILREKIIGIYLEDNVILMIGNEIEVVVIMDEINF